jgi:putative ABC transport system permease protein
MATLYTWLHIVATQSVNEAVITIILIALIVAKMSFLLATDFGIAMRATGNSPTMARAVGINNNTMKIAGLAIANALTAFSGYLICQYQGFTDINMGIGIVITGLGTVLIGDTLITWLKVRKPVFQLAFVVLGSVIFQLVLAFTLSMGVDPNMLKLVTAVFVLLIVYLPGIKLSSS